MKVSSVSKSYLQAFFLAGLFFVPIHPADAQGQTQTPCACCSDEARQFHFWTGEWEAFDPSGKKVGTNNIVLMEGGCVMQENWISATSGFTGTSYNFYNANTGRWQQLWLDNQGGNLQLEGSWTGMAMVLQGKPTRNKKGQIQIDRITWTPNADGSVRQLWEISVDEEKTWSVAFDGIYKRK